MENKELVACPVCDKLFTSSNIDIHVNKCLFLNSQQTSDKVGHPTSSKRGSLNDHDLSSPMKKIKKQDNGNEKVINSAPIPSMNIPLAERVRPTDLSDFIGQEHLTGKGKLFRALLDKNEVPSMILWGPPGCGKTTIATIISQKCKGSCQNYRFVKLSATMAGVNDIKEAVKIAKNEMNMKRKTILFMDEIHRFNKLQQDIFLPHVENGIITLIGATTENPSFSLNSALLSRCRVVVLEKLQAQDLANILTRALNTSHVDIVSSDHIKLASDVKRIEKTAVEWLSEICDGDARIALNTLQIALNAQDPSECISLDRIKDSLQKSHMLYDKKGEEHYNLISAMQKSIRASDDSAALYWVTRMLVSGEDPLYVARRLVRTASEDIGLADPSALPLAIAAMQGCQLIGMPECDVLLCECAVYLARAPKSKEVEKAMNKCKSLIKGCKGPQPSVPLRLRNAPTKLMKDLGYGRGYNTLEKSVTNISCMPEGMESVNLFEN